MVLDHIIWTVVPDLIVVFAAGFWVTVSTLEVALVAKANFYVFRLNVKASAQLLDLS